MGETKPEYEIPALVAVAARPELTDALGWKEPYVGLLILLPAILDVVRYYDPGAHWATWGSRAAKLGGVVLIFR